MILFNLGCDIKGELGLWVCKCSLLEVATSHSNYNGAMESAIELCAEKIDWLIKNSTIIGFLESKGFYWREWCDNDAIPNSDENYIIATTSTKILIFRKGMTMLRRLTQ